VNGRWDRGGKAGRLGVLGGQAGRNVVAASLVTGRFTEQRQLFHSLAA
jgi:hypothetical protein